MVTFTEEILNGKLIFLWSPSFSVSGRFAPGADYQRQFYRLAGASGDAGSPPAGSRGEALENISRDALPVRLGLALLDSKFQSTKYMNSPLKG